jgi:hypothetical protein
MIMLKKLDCNRTLYLERAQGVRQDSVQIKGIGRTVLPDGSVKTYRG